MSYPRPSAKFSMKISVEIGILWLVQLNDDGFQVQSPYEFCTRVKHSVDKIRRVSTLVMLGTRARNA